MDELLKALKGAKKLAQTRYPDGMVTHWLLPTGDVLEIITR